jgi:radical SAM protein with 4Fe4S-binding SPASM domain
MRLGYDSTGSSAMGLALRSCPTIGGSSASCSPASTSNAPRLGPSPFIMRGVRLLEQQIKKGQAMLPRNNRLNVLPPTAYAEILYGCNLRCNYCYVGEAANHSYKKIPNWQAWASAFQTAYNLGVNEMIFLGGEPLMHPQLEDLLRETRQAGFSSCGIVTNGTSITKAKARLLIKYGFWVDVTLRAADEKTWQSITGSSSSWHRLEVGLDLLSDHKIPLAIEFDCTPENYQQLYTVASWLAERRIEVRHIQLHRILPMGDAQAGYPENTLTGQQWNRVFEQASMVQKDFGIQVFMEDGLPFCLIDPSYWNRLLACACGHNLITIGPDFSLRRCACDPAAIAHLFDSPAEIHSALQVATSRDLPSPCKQCPANAICQGGCSASTINSNGHRPDHYSQSFTPIDPSTWQEHGLVLTSRRLTGQLAVEI